MIYVVEEQANPSSDFFVLPALSRQEGGVTRLGASDLPAAAELQGAMVVFVRYVPPAWASLVEAMRPQLARLVFFMDDDVLDWSASKGTPLRYRLKLARLAAWRKGWLKRMGAELWVSTPWLQTKYATWPPRLIYPAPLGGVGDCRRIFYHGTASHGAEIRWLRPVLEAALGRDERLVFEIVGGQDVYRLYRGLERVNVIHPMKWPAYQALLAMPGRHVGLSPQLDLPFNRARSYTKFFDITRCGAVGVYSNGSACAEVVGHGVDGLVVPLDVAAWAEAILQLAGDDFLRQAMLRNAERRMSELAARAQVEPPMAPTCRD